MNDTNVRQASQAEPEQAKKPAAGTQKSGAKMVSVLFIVFAGVFLWQSLGLYQDDPSLTGPSIFPLSVSAFLLLMGIIDLIQNIRKGSSQNKGNFFEQAKNTIQYLLPKNGLVFLGMSIAYLLMLALGIGFIISSCVFLMCSMCYLIPKQIAKNAMYTVLCVAILYIIFKVIFKVFLP